MKRTAIIAGLLSGLLFGIATPFSKLLLTNPNPFQLAGLLYIGAGIAMIPSIIKTGSHIKLLFNKNNLIRTLGIILFVGLLGPLLLLIGLHAADAASVSIWLNLELVATAILGVLIFKDSLVGCGSIVHLFPGYLSLDTCNFYSPYNNCRNCNKSNLTQALAPT